MNGKELGQQPANPCLTEIVNVPLTTGLTKREAFAMAAMQGIIASNVEVKTFTTAHWAVYQADALLEELSKGT